MSKPTVFIGSSSEGVEFARAARSLLEADGEVTLWNEGLFRVGATFIETLVNSLPRFDFAVLVLTPDDMVVSREQERFGPRDNVIFELGLFMGRLGRERTFMLVDGNSHVKIPSDLSGVTAAVYRWPRNDGNYKAALGAACDEIRSAIRDLGVAEAKTTSQIKELRSRQDTTESQVRALQFAVKGLVTEYEYDKLVGLASDQPFMVHYSHRMYDELRRLFTLQYVRTPSGDIRELHRLREQSRNPNQFNLKDYVGITDEGREYLRIRSYVISEN
jgi:hypothetical protein